jgi:hypothetical protein
LNSWSPSRPGKRCSSFSLNSASSPGDEVSSSNGSRNPLPGYVRDGNADVCGDCATARPIGKNGQTRLEHGTSVAPAGAFVNPMKAGRANWIVSPSWCRVHSRRLSRLLLNDNTLRCIWRAGLDNFNCGAATKSRSVASGLGHGAFPLIRRRRGELGASRISWRDSESFSRCSPQNVLAGACLNGIVWSIPGNNYVRDI